jgi:hypothetical protein
MENLQKLVPFFQELLQQWYELTLHNQEYAICLAVSVWLLTAIFYSIRIGFLKRHASQLAVARNAVQASLDEANLQLQALQHQLTEAAEKTLAAEQAVQAETDRANGITARLNESNQQLAGSLANLVASFELNQPNLPNADAGNLLAEYAAIVTRVVDRFQNEQQAKTQLQLSFHAESAKLAEKDLLIGSLQSRLDSQTQQLAKLELANEEYQVALRQLEIEKQNLTTAMQQQRPPEPVRTVEELKQPVYVAPQQVVEPFAAAVVVPAVDVSVPEVIQPAAQAVEISAPIEKISEPVAQPAPVIATKKSEVKPVPAAKPKPAKAEGGKLKGIFGRAMDKISKMDEKLGFEANPKPTIAEELPEADLATPAPVEQLVESIAPNIASAPIESVAAETGKKENKVSGMLGKLKFKK